MEENIENLKSERIVLQKKIKKCRTKHYKEIFKLLSELLIVEKKINPKYTMMQLSIDNDLSSSLVYRVLSWRYATPYAKKVVREDIIGMAKVCRVIAKVSQPVKQDELIKYIIEHKLTNNEIDLYITECEIKGYQLKTERITKSTWNAERNIKAGCDRLRRNLLSIKYILPLQKKEVIVKLTELNKIINNAIKILKNDTK
jgi:hypothetical protein